MCLNKQAVCAEATQCGADFNTSLLFVNVKYRYLMLLSHPSLLTPRSHKPLDKTSYTFPLKELTAVPSASR